MGESLVNIKADSVKDFIDLASKSFGGNGTLGETTYDISSDYSTENDKISKVTLKLTVNIERAHWSAGKPDADNKKAILAAEDLNKKHEQKHKKLAEDICSKEFAKAQKALLGKTEDEVQPAVDAIKKQVDDAYDALDKKEGMTKVTPGPGSGFTVKQVGR